MARLNMSLSALHKKQEPAKEPAAPPVTTVTGRLPSRPSITTTAALMRLKASETKPSAPAPKEPEAHVPKPSLQVQVPEKRAAPSEVKGAQSRRVTKMWTIRKYRCEWVVAEGTQIFVLDPRSKADEKLVELAPGVRLRISEDELIKYTEG